MRLTTRNRRERATHVTMGQALSQPLSATVAIGALTVIFYLDWATGSAPVQHLYYLPIIFAGVRFRMRGGVAAAVTAIVLYHLANPYLLTFRYRESDLVQVALFIVVGMITAKLTHDAGRLHALAMTDDLTGLHNLRSFETQLVALVRASRQTRAPLGLLVLDVDRLKSLNDKHGHLTGAEAVRTVGYVIAERIPGDAVACRYGGDEFVVAIPACPEARAREVADDLRRAVNATAPVLAAVPFPAATLSISVGLACRAFDRTGPSASDEDVAEALFRAADAALYLAKESGRNRIGVA
jgi:diguanylate cyclase (GGDEF)-like protein